MNTLTEQPAIQVNGVWKIFGDRWREALHAVQNQGISKQQVLEEYNCVVGVADASFEVAEGEIFCIMGLSGSGKSTLVRHVNRLLEPSAGHIHVNGDDVVGLNAKELRDLRNRRIAMVFQNFGLMPHRTVRDNVAMPLEIRDLPKATRWEEADRVLELVELSGWEDKYAHELSGGMQQRVGLARAIAADPQVLLMDEPFSALDPLIRRQLQDQFMQLAQVMKKTTLFITHDLDEAIRIGHRIAIMKDGRIIQIGTPEDIVTNPVDDYVADFVASISRLKFVHAASLMQSPEAYIATYGPLPDNAPRVSTGADLNTLIDNAIEWAGPIKVDNAEGETVGIIDRVDIMRGIQGNGGSE
ncbi:quaternary amine ABC transporter ATP-binding protein [Aliamphritea ceti]|uniref:quaternary amine ABC transporter ATP-binding protein n=1 Tax=Aliamphritea ceti TaxID=1524258 RepID=UPI0021C4607D|nr:glycine betaine/L-proline ABC transporter ATP-binding protein [Aliamphritea ceti]